MNSATASNKSLWTLLTRFLFARLDAEFMAQRTAYAAACRAGAVPAYRRVRRAC